MDFDFAVSHGTGVPETETGGSGDSRTASVPFVQRVALQECVEGSVRVDLARVLRGQSPSGFVRDEIVASWRESASMGLRPGRFAPPYDRSFDDAGELIHAAEPVLEQLSADLGDTDISVILSDEQTRIVARAAPPDQYRLDEAALSPGYVWRVGDAGTNALGMASATCSPTIVNGDEHFMEALIDLTMASAPVIDPRMGRLRGALSLVCPVRSANELLLPFARRAAGEVRHRLLDGSSAEHRFLEEQFRRARRRTRGPLALVAKHTLLVNAAASRVLTSTNQASLWAEAEDALAGGRIVIAALVAADGSQLVAHVEPVRAGSEIAGALLRFPTSGGAARGARKERPTLGWASLTDSELYLAELVAAGLTNKEAAARLIVSPHTVDTHLRHIFSKLDINSRVELARLVAERTPDHGVA
jgi:DNA-binding CsgD family transcriptional regulator